MKKVFLVALVIASMSSLNALEHKGEHNHGIHKKIADLDKRKTVKKKSLDKAHLINIAKEKLSTLVIQKKLHKSWLDAYDPVITRTKYKFVNDYMVVFHNPRIKKGKYKNLYIFVNSYGEIQGANYSGK